MGSVHHKGIGSPKAGEPLPYQDATPPRDVCFPKQQLPFDPRSPTDNIIRTPIIVDDIPKAVMELDPRSPTVGVERTPLSILLQKDTSVEHSIQCQNSNETTLPLPVSTAPFAPLCLPEETGDAEMTVPHKPVLVSDFDCLQDITDIDASPLIESACLPLKTIEGPTPLPARLVPHPKQLFPVSCPTSAHPAQKFAPINHFPLALVARDTNSPRTIMQAKQKRHLTKAFNAAVDRHQADKENFAC